MSSSSSLPSPESFLNLVQKRRTLKPADMDPHQEVSRETVESLLKAATWAPTHGMTEPWRFSVFTGEGRRQLGNFMTELYPQITPKSEQKPEKLQKLAHQPMMAPVVIAVGVKVGNKIPLTEEIQATACAIQNLWLAATTHGLGIAWSSPPVTTDTRFVRWLGLDDGDACLGILYLGWPKDAEKFGLASAKTWRTSIQEKTRWIDAISPLAE